MEILMSMETATTILMAILKVIQTTKVTVTMMLMEILMEILMSMVTEITILKETPKATLM